MSNVVVKGSDGIAPRYFPEADWAILPLDRIYTGAEGAGKIVPKINDYLVNFLANKWYRVTDLDPQTLISQWISLDPEDLENGSQVLIGEGNQPATFRAYLDTVQLPYQLSLDSRHYVNGSENAYARVFKGTNVGSDGQVISAVFNGTTYIDDKIPLDLVVYDDHTNLAQKSVPTFSTTVNLMDGEIVTCVIYNSIGIVTDIKRFAIERTGFIRPPNAGTKHIVGITLKSIFANNADPYVLDYPLNTPIGALNMTGIVHYNDGASRELPVDGTKFTLHGLESFIATRPGQSIPLSLMYRLDQGEFASGTISNDGLKITENYTIKTTFENGSFSPVLFGYPRWDNNQSKYVLRWWLMDLNRSIALNVTGQIRFNDSSDIFDGNNYDTNQFLSVSIRLSDASAALPDWIHTQTLYVKLLDPTLDVRHTGRFEVSQENVQGTYYGTNIVASTTVVNQNSFDININNLIPTLDEWLDALYYKAKPVYSLYREVAPPVPTHFTIMNDPNNLQTFAIGNWAASFKVFTNITDHGNLIVRWDRQLANGQTLQLATTEIPLDFQ
jgi:hypothetical protein